MRNGSRPGSPADAAALGGILICIGRRKLERRMLKREGFREGLAVRVCRVKV